VSYDSEVEENLALNRIIASLKKELYTYRKKESVTFSKTTDFETTRDELFSMSKRLKDAEEDILSFRHPVLQAPRSCRKERTPTISKIEIVEEVYRPNRIPPSLRDDHSPSLTPKGSYQSRTNLAQARRPEAPCDRVAGESYLLSREGSRRALRESPVQSREGSRPVVRQFKEETEPRERERVQERDQVRGREQVREREHVQEREQVRDQLREVQQPQSTRMPPTNQGSQADVKRVNRLDEQVG
jgi:hypothetical protein